MSFFRRHIASPTRIVTALALVAAMAGTAIAAGGGDTAADKKIIKRVVKLAAPKLSVKSAKKANSASSATTATNAAHAGDATNLGGLPASGYEQSSQFVRFSFTLPFGGQRPVAAAGPLSITAKCLQNATSNGDVPNQDVARIVISTTQAGAVFQGADQKVGANAGDFLDPATPETDRVFVEDNVATGTIHYDAGNQSAAGARAADGSTLGVIQDGTGLGENLFGTGCVYNGVAIVGR